MKFYIAGILLILCSALFAEDPEVANVRFEQRTDGSLLVDIYYDATDAEGDMLEIIIEASDNNGETWTLPCTRLTGDAGKYKCISPGTDKHVVWDFYEDNPGTSGNGFRVRVTANERACEEVVGLFITEDLTLVGDMKYPPGTTQPGIIIGASNITLDLGGHVISCRVEDGLGGGVTAENVDGITIRNGTFDGFDGAITLINTKNATLENLTVRNLNVSDPDSFIVGIGVGWSQNVVIRDCLFEFLPVMHKEAIVTDHSDITVSNIEVHGGSVGINFGGPPTCDPEHNYVNGTVLNSKFIEVGAGILLEHTTNTHITGNEFIRNETGIHAYGPCPEAITGLAVDGNEFYDGYVGIDFMGVTESSITNNVIKDNWRGIFMNQDMICIMGGPADLCFYSTGNVIADNIVTGNFIDLFHHENAVGNTWERNTCITKQGAEIPECTGSN